MDSILSKPDQIPDIVILERIIAGEKKLFELIMRRYNQRLYRIGMSILNSDDETEDAMQTAYISAYEHLDQFENRSSFATWLTRIMLNECMARQKKKQRFKMETESQLENHTGMVTPAQTLVNQELNTVLEKAVAQLPEKYRLVFVMREIEDMSVRETSEALSLEEPNVKVRLNRAKAMLRDHLDGYVKDQVYGFHLTRCDRIVHHVLAHLHLI